MSHQDLSDRELVDLCLQGEQQAWTEFLRRFQPIIAGVIAATIRRRTLPDRALVDDLVQAVLLKLCDRDCRAMRTFHWLNENSFRAFLKVVSSNAVQDYFRKPASRLEVGFEEEDEPDVPAPKNFVHGVDTDVLVQKLMGCLRRLLSAEDDLERNLNIFLFYYVRGFTAKEISRLYPLTIKAVENTLLRMVRIAKARCI
jgi:RNA polymerase sigma factor (sigma-70 family)